MSVRRTTARLCAIPAAVALVSLAAAAPASAHVTATPSVANAGAFTILTVSVPHGCDGESTTAVEISIPEEILAVTPTRNPYWQVETRITELDEPATDAHGNEVTERVGSVVYTADTPLPEGVRDTFELSFQVPDVAGETLAFPTVQTCAKGETAWVEIPEEGQDADELESPAPAFEVLPASGEGGHETATETGTGTAPDDAAGVEDDSDAVGWAGLGAGVLGLLAGGAALARSRRS